MPSVELTYQEAEEILESIIHNKRLVSIDANSQCEFVVFSHASADEHLRGRLVYKKALLEAEKEELPSISDVDLMLAKNNLIPKEDQLKIQELEEKLQAQKKLLDMTKIPGRRAPIEEVIKKYKEELAEIRNKREIYYYMSRERKADEELILFLVWASTHNPETGEKYWPSFSDFQKETNVLFTNEVIKQFSTFNRGLPTSTIRFLARHTLWRIRYVAALKVGGSLFCRDLADLTPDQMALLYWSSFYQSVYEMLPDEQPEETIIKDDDALDEYMERYFQRRDQERAAGKTEKRGITNKSKLNAWEKGDELIITPAHPAYTELAYTDSRLKDSVKNTSEVAIHTRSSPKLRPR